MTKILITLIQGYRWGISPMFPPVCRFYPSCSSYAVEALERYGWWKGLLMALGRLLRCHPFGGSGYDPVE